MKKNSVIQNNKNSKLYYEEVKKYRLKFFISNLIIAIVIFVILCGLIDGISRTRFFSKVENELYSTVEKINESLTTSNTLYIPDQDSRVTIAYYLADLKNITVPSNIEIVREMICGNILVDKITSNRLIGSSSMNLIKRENINKHYYMTYVINEWKKVNVSDNGTNNQYMLVYVKVYINIDGEVSSLVELNTGLFLCSALFSILGFLSSYLIMKYSLRPLIGFTEKQTTFVSDASHELRTPLAIVQSKLENILACSNQKVYDVSEDIAIALKEINRLTKLTQELLSIARSDQNTVVYNIEEVNINSLLKEVIDPFIEIAFFENKQVIYNGVDTFCNVDKDKIKEVIIILLDNAMKYTNPNDSIFIDLRESNSDVIIEVKDTGIGINEETKEKIFDRFYREDKARSQETGGNGLGLSIAKIIITALKGKITVDHNYPVGTKFVIVLPKRK